MVRLAEIARAAECSIGAVSKVLNPRSKSSIRVSETTRKRIEQAANKLGYRPNRSAEFLKKGYSPEIGIFLPSFKNDLVLDVIKGCSAAANRAGFSLSYFFDLSKECFSAFLKEATGRRNCGLITYPRFQIDKETIEMLANYRKSGGKVVFIESSGPETPLFLHELNRVCIDDRKGGIIVAEHFIEYQCRNFIVYGKYRPRIAGFIETVEKSGFTCRHFEQHIPAQKIIDTALKSKEKTGIFCTIDSVAANIHTGLLLHGEIPGKNILLCGYDCLSGIQDLNPGLTSVYQPFFSAGEAAVNMLIDLIYDKTVQDITFVPELVPRETSVGK